MSDEQPNTIPPKDITKGGVVAYLQVDGALKAAEFYTRAFGAETAYAIPPDDKGRTMHVHLHVNGSSVMLGDAYPEYGHPLLPPQAFNLTLMVDDIATWWDRAVGAGCTVVTPYAEMFWGDVWGQLRDPFGVTWALNQPKR